MKNTLDSINAYHAPRVAILDEASALAWEALISAHVNGDDETIPQAAHLQAKAELQAARDAWRADVDAYWHARQF
jgi:hypothetical protein